MSASKSIELVNTSNPPPYGQDAEVGGVPPPPSYETVYGKLKNAKKSASGPVDYLKKFFTILVSTIGFIIFVAVMLALPVSMIVVGSLNLSNCPLERFIPIWLVVSGSVFTFTQVIFIFKKCKEKTSDDSKNDDDNDNNSYSCFNGLLSCFNFAWFIAGNVWVFRNYQPNNTSFPLLLDYCDPTVYYFSFWLIIVAYIFMIIGCCCGTCVAICGIKSLSSKIKEGKNETTSGQTAE